MQLITDIVMIQDSLDDTLQLISHWEIYFYDSGMV